MCVRACVWLLPDASNGCFLRYRRSFECRSARHVMAILSLIATASKVVAPNGAPPAAHSNRIARHPALFAVLPGKLRLLPARSRCSGRPPRFEYLRERKSARERGGVTRLRQRCPPRRHAPCDPAIGIQVIFFVFEMSFCLSRARALSISFSLNEATVL